jgi:hypothetical protein
MYIDELKLLIIRIHMVRASLIAAFIIHSAPDLLGFGLTRVHLEMTKNPVILFTGGFTPTYHGLNAN